MDWIKENFKKIPEKPKGWVTVNEIAAQTGTGSKVVAEKIRQMVKSGELEVMDCLVNKKRAKCYRKKSK